MFQMVAGAPAIKSTFQTVRKEKGTKNYALLLFRRFPGSFHNISLTSHWPKLIKQPYLATREAGISSLLDEYRGTTIKLGFSY